MVLMNNDKYPNVSTASPCIYIEKYEYKETRFEKRHKKNKRIKNKKLY